MTRPAFVQSVFDYAMREINAHEVRAVQSEDNADAEWWEQARKVVAQLEAGVSQRTLAAQWINVRTGEPYSVMHVNYVKQVFVKLALQTPRPRFREAYNEIAHRSRLAVHQSSESVEHYTPPVIIDAVTKCLGQIDLDPCSNAGVPNVTAAYHYTSAEDGLGCTWFGKVYMNPPYGPNIIDRWVEKLVAEYEAQCVTEALALVPARTETRWFRHFRNYPVCFVEGRLTFIGNDNSAPFPSAVVYLGNDLEAFRRAFESVGDIWKRLA